MIASIHRFHGYGGLNGVYRRGQTVRSPLASLKYSVQNQKRGYRLAVVVSRKVSKSAVVRNRIRRRIYECIRLQEAHLIGAHDLVITVFSDQLATLDSEKLNALIVDLLQRAQAIDRKEES